MLKQCAHCLQAGEGPKPISEFCANRKAKDGFSRLCKHHANAYARKMYPARKDREKSRAKARRLADPAWVRHLSVLGVLRRTYGLSEFDYANMFAAQHGRCKVCERELISLLDKSRPILKFAPNEVSRVDHCHQTGRIRGLLCNDCNTVLGKVNDDPKVLLAAARYLQETATAKVVSRPRDEKSERNDEPREAGPLVEQRRGSRRDELNQFLN
jgi:hypothetical protein